MSTIDDYREKVTTVESRLGKLENQLIEAKRNELNNNDKRRKKDLGETVKRIKFENEGVSLYQESSFCDFISLKGFEHSKMEELEEKFRQYY